jgi:hypothetical protein
VIVKGQPPPVLVNGQPPPGLVNGQPQPVIVNRPGGSSQPVFSNALKNLAAQNNIIPQKVVSAQPAGHIVTAVSLKVSFHKISDVIYFIMNLLMQPCKFFLDHFCLFVENTIFKDDSNGIEILSSIENEA